MTFHVNRGLHHGAVLNARQATSLTISAGRPTTTSTARVLTPTSSSSRPRDTSASISGRSTSISVSSTLTSSRPVSSSSTSSLINTSRTSKTEPLVLPTTSTSTSISSSSVSSSVPTAQSAAKSTRKNGSLAGVIIGILIAIFVIILVIVFIFKRVRKRRDRVDEARFFNKDKLQRPGMVQGIVAGPGVGSLNGIENEKDSRSQNIEKSLPPSPYPFDTPQHHRGITNMPPSPYGTGDPAFHSGSSYSLNRGQQEWGAPPIPGSNGPAPYSPYMANFSKYASMNQTTPPGSPFGGGNSMQNPFATPSGTDTHPSTPTSVAWPHTPMGAHHLPLLPGGVFANDSFRDSGYSAAYSDVHVGQAYKVQVGLSMPKYEDLTTTTTTRDTPGSPPPPFTPFDPAATVNNADPTYTGPAPTVDNKSAAAAHKSLPPRPVSTHTIYNPEDAYGGV